MAASAAAGGRVRTLQYLLAAVFFVLGGWCVVSPGTMLALCIRPAFRSDLPIVTLLAQAFGAQALIAGLFAAFSTFTARTFLAYGLALIPFFVFDAWFYVVRPMLTPVGLLDAVGNVIMLAVCWMGWRAARRG
ncbi:MAG TPA: hypothetical protein VG939_21760 [Caulobacteraceae bacterium]|nr:hypothetical protein [Caulobacteraceae bacterium]